jgi:hypothetical protein
MSPLRRLWLAWGGGWELPIGAAWIGCVTFLLWFKLVIIGGEYPTLAERPFVLFFLLPLPIGFRLRRLIEADGLALMRGHTTWALRWLCFAILPVIAGVIALSQLLTGIPLLWAVAVGVGFAALGAWMGFARGLSFVLASGAALVVVTLLRLVPDGIGWQGNVVAGLTILVVCFGVRAAWRQLESRTVQVWTRLPVWRFERLSAWFDAWTMDRRAPIVESGRLPTLLTAAWVGFSGLGASRRMGLIGILLMAVGAFAMSSTAPDITDRLTSLLCITTMIAYVLVLAWLSVGQGEDRRTSGQARRLVRGLLATERLHPLSRRQASAATMLSLIGNSLRNVLPLIGGMLLGLLLSDAWLGRDSSGLWMLLPHALMVTACSMAGVLLLLVLPKAVAIIGCVLLVVILLGALIVMLRPGTGDYPGALLLVATGLALLLVPFAWWRLAESDLP